MRDALRMRPDRIVVGEMRDGPAALEALKAWNTGHPSGVSKIHAKSAPVTFARLKDLLGEVVVQPPRRLIAQALGLVHVARRPAGRRVQAMLALDGLDAVGGYRIGPAG